MVTGLGLVGHLAAQTFASCGYRVAAVDPVESRRAIAIENGIAPVFATVPLDDPAYVDQIDLVLECAGHEQAAIDAARIVRKRGEVVLVGTPWRRYTEAYAHELTRLIFHRYVVMRSGWEWELPLHPEEFRKNSLYGNFEGALRWLAEGRVRVKDLYTKVPPREAQTAYQDLVHKRTPRLAIVFDWEDCP
jgi:threonine dehydrogenase-like Zn-dependent dehydrogenase